MNLPLTLTNETHELSVDKHGFDKDVHEELSNSKHCADTELFELFELHW